MTNTKTYCETLSLHRLKNQRPNNGKHTRMTATQATTEKPNRYQNAWSAWPVASPTTTVNTIKAKMSVMIVPPTAIVTAWSRVMPKRLTIG